MKKIKILLLSPNPQDANSFWRAVGPMNYMAKHSNGEIDVIVSDPTKKLTWLDFSGVDLVFLHRPCNPQDLIFLQLAWLVNVPVWVEFDDWLFNLPGWNPAQTSYHQMGVKHTIAMSLACADLISVTTNQLADLFKPINENVRVVPNAYRSDFFPYRTDEIADRDMKKGYWRGSNTHEGDVLSVGDGFRDMPYNFNFIGDVQWTLLSQMKPESYTLFTGHNKMDPLIMMAHIWDIRPKVMVFPLVDCLFNRCKSNIAYIEAMHAGAICVAPDMPEWRKEGIFNYEPSNAKSFREQVDKAFDLPMDQHRRLLESAFNKMKDEYDIAKVNEARVECVRYLTSPEFKKTKHSPFNEQYGVKTLGYVQKEILSKEAASG